MLNRLKLLVSSTLLVLVTQNISAKEIPITEEVEIAITVGKFSVVEFPFKITSKNVTSFLLANVPSNKTDKEHEKSLQDQLMDEAHKTKMKKGKRNLKKPRKRKSKYISIIKNVNSLTFFPKKEGVVKMVVWGYSHPILLSVKAVRKDGFGLYQFTIPQSLSKDVILTEQGGHEKVINKLMIHLFNQTLPKGYKSRSEDAIYESNGFSFRLNREVVGKKYLGQEWILTNNTELESNIHEESFYQKGIYGISLEADRLKPKESCRVFIVRTGSKKRVKNER